VYQSKVSDGKVIKSFLSPWSLKWVISIPTIVFYPYSINPRTRLFRELSFFIEWRKKNHSLVRTPRVLKVDYTHLTLVREYIEGNSVHNLGMKCFELLFKALAFIHKEGWTLGDPKPSNFLVDTNNRIFVIDAEQAVKTDNIRYMAWDIALLLLMTNVYATIKGNILEFDPKYLLEEYLSINQRNSIARFSLRYFEKIRSFRENIMKYMYLEI